MSNLNLIEMKKLIIPLMVLYSLAVYAQEQIPSAKAGVKYGKQVDVKRFISVNDLEEKLQSDTTYVGQIEGKVVEVCKKKGCFMQIERGSGGDPILVRFKDYGFFMPQDIVGKTVLMEGVAKVKETSVERQKHWAEDAGKTAAEIAMISTPKIDIEIIADGVVVVK